ncbi:MAG: hypothetical protein AAF939_02095 [Planctomycetota bacterium]
MPQRNSPPTYDGDTKVYLPDRPPRKGTHRFIYVNGIDTSPIGHQAVAEIIANITQHPVTGIYNETNGMLNDLKQCVGDWLNIVQRQIGEHGFLRDRLTQSMIDKLSKVNFQFHFWAPYAHALREAYIAPDQIPATHTISAMQKALSRNLASLALFDELRQHLDRPQIVVAHSQGNLITSFALWGLQAVYGSLGLANLQIRSISSPAPAWPRGINHQIKVYGQKDDPVTWCDPKNWSGNRSAGFWETFFRKSPGKYIKSGGIAAHSVEYNIYQTSLFKRLRADAGIEPFH